MRSMRQLLILGMALVWTWHTVEAQQIPKYTQFMNNKFVLNPAVAGSKGDVVESRFSYRAQWAGLEGAPTTQTLSIHSGIPGYDIGLGAILFNDVAGPRRRTGLQLAYAYQIELSPERTLSLGLGGGFFQSQLNFTELEFDLDGDPIQFEENLLAYNANMDFGAYFYSPSTWIGFSVPQGLQTKTRFVKDSLDAEVRLVRHYVLLAGHKVRLSPTFVFQPTTQVTSIELQPIQVDVSFRGFYKDQYWAGASIRTDGSFAFLAGLEMPSGFSLGYSYEQSTTLLNTVSSGSHELILGFDFIPRNRKSSPIPEEQEPSISPEQ